MMQQYFSVLKTKYDQSTFQKFTHELLNDIEVGRRELEIDSPFKDHIASLAYLGSYQDPQGKNLHILDVTLKTQTKLEQARTMQRNLIAKYLKDHWLDGALVAFHSDNSNSWRLSFVKVEYKYDDQGKTREEITPARRYSFLVGEDEPTHTAQKQLLSIYNETNHNVTLAELEDTFSVERVTEEFFKGYKSLFNSLMSDFKRHSNDLQQVHDFSQLLLNRIMFVYFIDKKQWLGDKPGFLKNFWKEYGNTSSRDVFYPEWLSVLFFEAFNNTFFPKTHFPAEINQTLQLAPYLNGGLFARNKLDDIGIRISDETVKRIFDFFDIYNFTIREDSPLEIDVAVDPEMIGKVYESLVNLSETTDERGDAGIFYTPRVEIDFMCRLSLVEYFYKHLGATPSKDDIYKLLFAKTDDEFTDSIDRLRVAGVWPQLFKDKLDSVTIIDPAVGSGSFLVEMLRILSDLYKHIYADMNRTVDDFDVKKQVIGRSLYGVDVMDWAVHVCELRLWLSLIVEAEIPLEERKLQPLLPNLTFKIRQGDSLVEELAGIDLSFSERTYLNPVIKRKITALKQAKYDFFFNNRSSEFYQSAEMVKHEEIFIFRMIIEEEIYRLQNEIAQLSNNHRSENIMLPGMGLEEKERQQTQLFDEENRKKTSDINNRVKLLEQIRKDIQHKKPFVWDIDFVEIFADEYEQGFDIVIGNPPYVRQEKIADPKLNKEEITPENKKEYREKLIKSVKARFPHIKNLDPKSDLYIYFYFHGLALLNKLGTLCFITSNSWLDAGYGKDLQAFLLNSVPIRAIIDNQAKRSFVSADVNTTIMITDSPQDYKNSPSGNRVQFVMYKKPFENIINANNLIRIDNTLEYTSNDDFRIFPATQYELLRDGWEFPDNFPEVQKENFYFQVGSYGGNKWGGKFLRAPDIYWKVIGKGKALETKLSRFVEGERYLNTGGADGFFIPTEVEKINEQYSFIRNNKTTDSAPNEIFEAEIENKYLQPLIKDYTKRNKDIEINGFDSYCFVIDSVLPREKINDYIKWGEKQDYHKRSVTKTQKPWYKPTLQMQHGAKILFPRSFSDVFIIHSNPKEYLSLRFYRLHTKNQDGDLIAAYLNSTLFLFFLETLGNKNLGLGALDFYMEDFLKMKIPVVLDPKMLEPFNVLKTREIHSIFKECGIDKNIPIRGQNPKPISDRRNLDEIVFNALGLTDAEKNEIYLSLCELVHNRFEKARSV